MDDVPATKKCPYCAEEVRAEAIKCRYCGSDLRQSPTAGTPPKPRSQKKRRWLNLDTESLIWGLAIAGMALMTGFFAGLWWFNRPPAARTFAVATATPTSTSTATPSPTNTLTPTPTYTPSPSATPTLALIVLTDEEMASIAFTLSELEAGFAAEEELTGPVTYEVLLSQGSEITAEYVRSLGDVHIYRSAFTRQTSLMDVAVVHTWVWQFVDVAVAHKHFEIHPTLYEMELSPLSFPPLAEESIALSGTTTSGGFTVDGYHVLMRTRNVVAVLNYGVLGAMADIEQMEIYARTLERRLLEMVNTD